MKNHIYAALTLALVLTPACVIDAEPAAHQSENLELGVTPPAEAWAVDGGGIARGELVRFETPGHDPESFFSTPTDAAAPHSQPAGVDETGAAIPPETGPQDPRPLTREEMLHLVHEDRLDALRFDAGCDGAVKGQVAAEAGAIGLSWGDPCLARDMALWLVPTEGGWLLHGEEHHAEPVDVTLTRSAPDSDWGLLELSTDDAGDRFLMTAVVSLAPTRDLIVSSRFVALVAHERAH